MTEVVVLPQDASNREGSVGKKHCGFAAMSPEKQRNLAGKGGRAAHLKGTAYKWDSESAREAGRKGGHISRGGRGRLLQNDEDAVTDKTS